MFFLQIDICFRSFSSMPSTGWSSQSFYLRTRHSSWGDCFSSFFAFFFYFCLSFVFAFFAFVFYDQLTTAILLMIDTLSEMICNWFPLHFAQDCWRHIPRSGGGEAGLQRVRKLKSCKDRKRWRILLNDKNVGMKNLFRTNEITASVCEEMHLECTDYFLSKVHILKIGKSDF